MIISFVFYTEYLSSSVKDGFQRARLERLVRRQYSGDR